MTEIRSINDESEYIASVGYALSEALGEAVAHRGIAHLSLTGGTIGIAVLRGIPLETVDWMKVHVWWGDERFLTHDSKDRNCVQAESPFVSAVAELGATIHRMPASDEVASLDEAVAHYAQELSRFGASTQASPAFDVILLGMGPDAHVASLFPNHRDAHVHGVTCAVRNSPKPPPERISLTYDAINTSREVWLLVKDAAKHDALMSVLGSSDDMSLPASAVHGTERTIIWTDDATLGR
jgi:6-phosphogluconolactonase